jgi:hypothetical protein
MSGLINEKLENVYKPPRARLAMQTKEKIEIKNEIAPSYKPNSPAKILFSAIKECNGVVYRIIIAEFSTGKRICIVERQATDRLPRAIVSSPPAPLAQYVKKLKRTYGIE